MTEEWRPVEGFSYEVSSRGRVRRAETGRVVKSQFIKARTDLYERVELWRHNHRHIRYVHRLVAQAFIPNPERKPEVNHLDENTLNNAVSNLEWSTRSENEAHKRFMRATA